MPEKLVAVPKVYLFRLNYPKGRRVVAATDNGVSAGYSHDTCRAIDLYMGDDKARWTMRIPIEQAQIVVKQMQRLIAEYYP